MSVNPLKKHVVLYKELSEPLMQRLQAETDVTLIKRLDAQGPVSYTHLTLPTSDLV